MILRFTVPYLRGDGNDWHTDPAGHAATECPTCGAVGVWGWVHRRGRDGGVELIRTEGGQLAGVAVHSWMPQPEANVTRALELIRAAAGEEPPQ